MTRTACERDIDWGSEECVDERHVVIEGFDSLVEHSDSLAWWGAAALVAGRLFKRPTR